MNYMYYEKYHITAMYLYWAENYILNMVKLH